MDEAATKQFWGEAGESVPQVDPSDIRAAWELGQEMEKNHLGVNVGIGVDVFQHACKPGANIQAVTYRANMLGMLLHVAPSMMEPLVQDKLDAAFRAAATIPMEWIGAEVRKGFPFDADDFIRRVREAA